MNNILTSDFTMYNTVKNNIAKNGSYIMCVHYWFEYKIFKNQYFLGKCFSVRRKGLLSSLKVRTFCYKTVMEILLFLNSPSIGFIYSFIREVLYKKMSFVFLRKSIKAK